MNDAKTYAAAVAALALVVLGVIAWLRTPDPATTATSTTLASTADAQTDPLWDARTKGEPDAPITIFEMSDFQCPFCRQFFEETMPALEQEYINTGKARLTYVNLPLIQIHKNAARAAEWAMCSAAQGRFWPAHDRLFETQADWQELGDPTPHFFALAESLGLDRDSLTQCMDDGTARSIVAFDVQLALRNRLSTTPTFVIEGGILEGAHPIEDWRGILDSIYTAKTGREN